MKLFNLNHIAMVPYSTCNFHCEYCVADRNVWSVLEWREYYSEVSKFLGGIEQKAIMVSGGEPLLWDWSNLIKSSGHYWYFLSNLSLVSNSGGWIKDCKKQIKFFLAAFHPSQISLEKFTGSVKLLQDMDIPVFVKVIYTNPDTVRFVEHFWKHGIASSIVLFVGRSYDSISYRHISSVIYRNRYISSVIYRNRFERVKRWPLPCRAGSKASFEIRGTRLDRCSQWGFPYNKLDNLGTVAEPRLHSRAYPCPKLRCECEWHQFSELAGSNDNEQWQKFVDTGVWS